MAQSPLFAAIDLGSNSFHMLVVRHIQGAIRIVAKLKRKVRLASGLDHNLVLNRASMERGWDCLKLFAEQLEDIPDENIRIVGTATLRYAKNVDTFVRIAEEILGHKIEVISGLEEARTIYQGVSWTSSGIGHRLVIDVGGASTEVVLGENFDAQILNSLPLGCVTWLDKYFSDGKLNSVNFNNAIAGAKEVFRTIVHEYLCVGWSSCVGASGTVQALQEIMLAQGTSERITLEKLNTLKEQSIACGSIDNLSLEGLLPERLTVFASGLSILIALFEVFGVKEMTLAGGALREGLIYGMISIVSDESRFGCGDAQERTVNSMISRYQLDAEQGNRVRQTCIKIFEQLKEVWGLDERYRPILESAACLYELGLCIEYKKAPQHAAYIVDNVDMPGFSVAQKQLLSALLFNQKNEFKLDVLKKQHAVSEKEACCFARILRFAIILCIRRTEGTVPSVSFSVSNDELIVGLPKGWLAEHYLRASELTSEAAVQTYIGWNTKIEEVE